MYVITDCFNFSFSEDALVLAEMFPEASSLEIRNCLMVSNGDVESAVQLMLLKKENIDDEGKENYHQVLDLSPRVHERIFFTSVQHVQEPIVYLHKMLSTTCSKLWK